MDSALSARWLRREVRALQQGAAAPAETPGAEAPGRDFLLWNGYPWRRLMRRLRIEGYDRFALAEIPESADPATLIRYYWTVWNEWA
jgi:hypothetical protein